MHLFIGVMFWFDNVRICDITLRNANKTIVVVITTRCCVDIRLQWIRITTSP